MIGLILICGFLICLLIVGICAYFHRRQWIENLDENVLSAILTATQLDPDDFEVDRIDKPIRSNARGSVRYFEGTPLELYNEFIKRERQKYLDKMWEKMSEIYNKTRLSI